MVKRKSQFFTEAIVGVFMTAVILLLGYFTIVISGVDVLAGDKKVEIKVAFTDVGGLKDHDNVFYRGTKVGTVEEVEVTPSNLVVRALIERAVVIRKGYRFTVAPLSMLGGNCLRVEEGTGEQLPLESTFFVGDEPMDWMRDVSAVAKELRELSEKINRENVVGETKQLIGETRDAVAAFRKTAESFNGDKIVPEVRELIGETCEAVAAFRKAAESFNGEDLSKQAGSLAKRADTLLESLNNVAKRIENGEGTMGKLVNDPELYTEMNSLIKDVRQIIDNYRDTTPISTFTSLATGAL